MAPGVEEEEFHLPLCLSQRPSSQVHLYLSQGSMIESPQTRDGPYHLHLHGTCDRRQAWKIFPAVVVAAAAVVVVVAHLLTPFRVQTSLFEPQPQPQPNPTLDLPLRLSSQDLDSPPPHATMQRERDLRAGKQERERGRRSSSFWSCSSVAGTQTGNFAACVQPALFSPLPRSQAEGARYAAWCVCCLNCWGRKTKRWKKANRRFSHHHHIQGVVVWKH